MSQIRAWLHEVEAADWGVNTYWITEKKVIQAFYPLTAEFFLAKTDRYTEKQLLSHPHIESTERVSKYLSIHDQKPSSVLRIRVNPRRIRATYEDLRKYWGEYLHNADLSLWQQFCFQTKLFPYAYAEIDISNRKLRNWRLLESYTQMDYQPVPFRSLWFQPFFEDSHLSRGRITKILMRRSVIDQEEEPIIFEEQTEAEIIRNSIRYIQQVDPDLLFTRGGDTFVPIIAERSVRIGEGHLRVGRGFRPLKSYVRQQNAGGRGHSYMSYGRVFYSQHGAYFDGGRHHYDVGNSFMWKDGNIAGIHELVRLGCSDPQRIARGTIGTTLSAVQMRTAYYRDILIPARKADPESFRPAWTMETDVGGLVFSPRVGFHANVAELDFLSMYPNIMVHRNVSPETVNCACCVNNKRQLVPLTNYHVCTKRPGIIGLSLKNILNRRQYYKAKRNVHPDYDRRQKVLKWLLVTCFPPNTVLPVFTKDKLKLVEIGSFIDHILEKNGSTDEMTVIGVDKTFHATFNPIKRAFRLESPLELYRIRLETGRELVVTGDHICYVLSDGNLQEKEANEISNGDFLPVMLKMPEITSQTSVNALERLLDIALDEDLDIWRVWGSELTEYIQAKKSEIKHYMENHHSQGAIRTWLRGGFIPLRYFPLLEVPRERWKTLKIGCGRRGGGELGFLPADFKIDGDLGFFLGYFIGDGSARPTFLRLSVNSADTDLIVWFEKFIAQRFGLDLHKRKEPHTQMFTLQINSSTLVRILTDIFRVARTRALGKLKVPPLILNGPEEAVFGFFGGLIASDGDVHPDRNVIRISSCDYTFIQELAYLATRIGLYTTLQRDTPQKGSLMYNLCFTGKETLALLLNSGYIKRIDEIKIESKNHKIRSRAWMKDFPVEESGLLALAKKARTVRKHSISGKVRTSREIVRTQLQQIKEREKLSSTDLKQLKLLEKMVNGDLGFARVVSVTRHPSDHNFVYCFEVTDEYPGFVAGAGGIFSHNCFGYTGYRNARFGRIESHEAISAYSRHGLTLTQQIASRHGLEVVAGIVDSVWMKDPEEEPLSPDKVGELRQEIADTVKLPVDHACDYHWIIFLPRRHERKVGVLNRYYGLKTDGTFRIRGIEIRQSSSPPLIKKLQMNMLNILAKARSREQFQVANQRAERFMKRCSKELEAGKVPLEELLITIRPSRSPDEYINNSRQAIAAKQLASLGLDVEPGMKISYLILDAHAKKCEKRVKAEQLLTGDEHYDVDEYQKLMIRAYENLIPPEFNKENPTLESYWPHVVQNI
ncbi:MAG: DNA polymerase domain-containing protein [Candidatus Hodarchaeota archaeon]